MYWVTGCTLVQMGQVDPAFLAIREGLIAAQKGNDPLLAATLRGSVAWQLLMQGCYEESHNIALEAAAAIELAGDVGQDHLAVYGSLALQSATAAGRSQKPGAALDLADAAGEVAARIGEDTKHYECGFGPSQVVMQTTDIQISDEQYAEAVTAPRHAARRRRAGPGVPGPAPHRPRRDDGPSRRTPQGPGPADRREHRGPGMGEIPVPARAGRLRTPRPRPPPPLRDLADRAGAHA